MIKLTDKQKKFVEEYLIDLNATQAAIRAGYSEKTAGKIGHQLLEKTRTQEAIQKAKDRRSKRTEITQDMVLKELALIGFSDMRNYVDFNRDGVTLKELSDISEEHSKTISEVSHGSNSEGTNVKFKLYDKRAALVDIGKHLGMFVEKLNVDVNLKVGLANRIKAGKERVKNVS